MKLWIASYPRSGNTFLRMILNEAFEIKSTSIYEQEDDGMADRPWLVGPIGYAGRLSEIENISAADKWIGVKTHDGPIEHGPAIYVVRDGCSAIVSYYHFIRSFNNKDTSLDQVIEGKVWPGSWSAHFAAWDPDKRPSTLLLRYEDLLSDIDASCKKISQFLGVEQRAPFTQRFDEFREKDPRLFRTADNDRNIAEMSGHLRMFDSLHGGLMKKLGYSPDALK